MKAFSLPKIRQAIRFKVRPVRDLISVEAVPLEWVSTGEHPTFSLELENAGENVPAGWIYIDSKMVRRGVHLVARLYIDTGGGFTDTEYFVLPATRAGSIKQIIKLPANVCRMRLVPMRGEGRISWDYLKITRISTVEKNIRMLEWVIGDIVKFKNTNQAKRYDLTWRRLLTDLEGAYADCRNLRFHSEPMSYVSYIDKFDRLYESDVILIKQHIKSFKRSPTISILLNVCNAKVGNLKNCIQSVLDQIYDNWQLCIAISKSESLEVVSCLQSISRKYSKIKIEFLNVDDRPAVAMNLCLGMAIGEFSATLDQSDRVAPHALYFVACGINKNYDAHVVYSDEDKIDNRGKRFDPNFKSGWNRDLFFSLDYVRGLTVYNTMLLREVGGFRVEFEGALKYDVALRCIKKCESSQIIHIPRILYHRFRGDELAHNDSSSDMAGEAALADFFADQIDVKISGEVGDGMYRVQYPLPTPNPCVTIIIPTRDGCPLLKRCIDSILGNTNYDNIEIVVIDNQSEKLDTIDYLEYLSEQGVKVLKYDRPFNYSAINNFAVTHASGDILCFLNDDVEAIEPEWLKEMVSHALRPDIGAVGAKLLYADNFVQHAGVIMGIGGFAGHAHRLYPSKHAGYTGRAALIQNFSAVTGACMVMRRNLFVEIGGFDEKNLPVAFNDVDLCLRLGEAGYRILWTPYAVLYHFESYSRGDDQASSEKRARFNLEKKYMIERWETNNANDPYYNENLTLDREDFTIANFPRISNPWQHYINE